MLAILTTAALAFSLNQTMIVPALPAFAARHETAPETATWLVTAFLLSASVCTPLVGRLGDVFGKGRTLFVVLAVFTLGSVVSGAGGSIAALIAGRALQGVGGAIMPLAFGIVRDVLPAARVATAIGLISATIGLGSGLGLVLAGLFIDHLSVTWIFWSAALVTAAAGWATWRYVPSGRRHAAVRLDWAGGGMMAVGLFCLLLAISQGNGWGWTSTRILALFAVAAVVLVVFARFELGRTEPMIDLRMLAARRVWSVNVAAFGIGFALFTGLIMVPTLVQVPESTGFGLGGSATLAGLAMLPCATAMLAAGPVGGWLGTRHGSRLPLAVGAASASAAFAILAAWHATFLQLALGTALLGVGVAMAIGALGDLAVSAVRAEQTGAATGIAGVVRLLGGAVGAQVGSALVFAGAASAAGLSSDIGFTRAFTLSSIAALVALATVALIPGRGPAAVLPAMPPTERGPS